MHRIHRTGLGISLAVCGLAAPALAHDILYALSNPLSPKLSTLDPDTGQELNAVFIIGHEALFGGLGADTKHSMLYSIDGYNDPNPDRLFKIDPTFGTGVVVGPTGENWNFRCVEVHPETGVIYAIRDNALYTLDGATGAAALIKSLSAPTLDQLTSLAIAHTGEAYGTDIGDTGLFKIDLATGAMTHLGNIGGSGNWYQDMAFDSTGRLLACRQGGGVYDVNVANATEALAFGGTYIGLAFMGEAHSCYPDCDGSGALDIDDFICFQTFFALGDPYADCDGDGLQNIDDFICFQTLYAFGC
jgi:hypothetical protein